MAQRKLRFALFGNVYQAKKSVSIQKILSFLSEHKAEIYIEKEFFEFLTQGQHYEVVATRIFEGRDFDADFVISMGGDGTFLKKFCPLRGQQADSHHGCQHGAAGIPGRRGTQRH